MRKQIPPLWGIIIVVVFSSLVIVYLMGLMASFPPEAPLPGTEKGTAEDDVVQLPEKIEIPEEMQKEIEEKGGVVRITAEGFEPKEITLTQGESISWVNYDSKVHQVVSDSIFNTEEMDPADIWTFPCNEKGTFEYWLREHPEQKGKIIVK